MDRRDCSPDARHRGRAQPRHVRPDRSRPPQSAPARRRRCQRLHAGLRAGDREHARHPDDDHVVRDVQRDSRARERRLRRRGPSENCDECCDQRRAGPGGRDARIGILLPVAWCAGTTWACHRSGRRQDADRRTGCIEPHVLGKRLWKRPCRDRPSHRRSRCGICRRRCHACRVQRPLSRTRRCVGALPCRDAEQSGLGSARVHERRRSDRQSRAGTDRLRGIDASHGGHSVDSRQPARVVDADRGRGRRAG